MSQAKTPAVAINPREQKPARLERQLWLVVEVVEVEQVVEEAELVAGVVVVGVAEVMRVFCFGTRKDVRLLCLTDSRLYWDNRPCPFTGLSQD
nr:hypothetical protein BaRGS_026932 [Batillaria attramentaria]